MNRVPTPPAWAAKLFTVGVTGTNGKTTTTAWVAAALRTLSTPVARATTVGFFLDDVPLEIEKSYDGFLKGMRACVDRGGTHAATELTSEALARGFARAWPCRVGVFTNLTHDHLDAHGSPEHYLASKAQLFVSLPPGGTAVLNASDENYPLLKEVTPQGVLHRSYAVPSRGAVQGEPDIVATSIAIDWAGTRIACKVKDPSLPAELRVRAIGAVYAENALAALLGAVAAGADPRAAADAIAAAPAPPGRFEVIHERPWVVVDYAHSPDALARTVAIARELAGRSRLFVVFGAGGKRDKDKRGPMGEAARPADVVLLTTDNPRDEDPSAICRAIAEGLTGHAGVRTELDRAKAIAAAIREASPDDVVLIAGKGHETEMTVGAEVRHFSDVEAARTALSAR
ncbi:MAG: UDP-N-acetylmuramyl-tripeptide synthetase [Labilithrix sp.]|nr:UDP-N-acetylmuramyl-tripeptide synthetase [Labilithrix sp.]MCW5812301.1 UDP-N-acetylmuramyl-tripeptide synthetase [Labilithrix sp.]